ncbi:hypothetical protein CRUP_036180 [Coryphaenoides rupestris]|nr:hypothetical protein CRUP_036180 [Coryphaenoides rupestris]
MQSYTFVSYVSACVNPIIYCFMNKRFRQGVLATFSGCRCGGNDGGGGSGRHGHGNGNRGAVFGRSAGRGGGAGGGVATNGLASPTGTSVRFTYLSVRQPAGEDAAAAAETT